MKTNGNITLFAGARDAMEGSAAGNAAGKQAERKTVFAGNLKPGDDFRDRVEERKEQARQKAMKIVGDVFESDKAVDADIEGRREHVRELIAERRTYVEEQNDLAAQRESLDKAWESGELTEEEYERMGADLAEHDKECTCRLNESERSIKEENSVIRGIKRERLKKDPMVKAQKQAEETLQDARDEIVDMGWEEGREHIEEESGEREEKAEKIEEERKKQEEFIEGQKEKREEEEELLTGQLAPEELTSLMDGDSDVQREVREMLQKMKLLEEDLKGAVVDETR